MFFGDFLSINHPCAHHSGGDRPCRGVSGDLREGLGSLSGGFARFRLGLVEKQLRKRELKDMTERDERA